MEQSEREQGDWLSRGNRLAKNRIKCDGIVSEYMVFL